jgi:hypothetical protein
MKYLYDIAFSQKTISNLRNTFQKRDRPLLFLLAHLMKQGQDNRTLLSLFAFSEAIATSFSTITSFSLNSTRPFFSNYKIGIEILITLVQVGENN